MDIPTKPALMQFLETSLSKGWINSNTGNSWKAAANRILENVGDSDDLSKIDVKSAVLQFNNRHPGMMSGDSLRAYEQRVSKAISEFVAYRADPMTYKAPSRAVANGKPTTKKVAATAEKVVVEVTQDAPLSAADNKPIQRFVTETSLAMPFPLRPTFLAQIVIPRDLTKAEAERMCSFIMTLAQAPLDV